LTGFQKSTIFKTCWLLIQHHFVCSNEEKDFWIIDWFLTVDLVQPIPFFLRSRGTPPDQVFLEKSATQPVQLDVQAEGVNWLPTKAWQLPAGASNSAGVGLAKGNLARGLQWCWSHPSSPKNKKVSFLGLGRSVSYRPVWPSENVVLKEKK
jgi:hypothetical protein